MRRKTKQKVIAIFATLTGLVFLGAGCGGLKPPSDPNANLPKVTLEYWSVFNNTEEMQAIITKYRETAPNVTINYRKLDITEYENELIDALATGRGPDIFSVHNTWIPEYTAKLEPIPADQSGIEDFVPVVKDAAVVDGQTYGLPLSVDTLAMFYNPKLLSSAGVAAAPTTWDEFDDAVKKLVQFDGKKNFTREGAAIGTISNVSRGIDPLMLLMLQNGTEMVNEAQTEATFANTQVQAGNDRYSPGLAAFNKFLSYSRPSSATYTWNAAFSSAFDEFKDGKLGILFNYAFNRDRIQNLDPKSDFRVAAVPQITNTQEPIALANFWLEGVSKKSEQQLEAWKFIVFATGSEGGKIYADATMKPGARFDILETQESDRNIAPFAKQALIAKTWYQKDPAAIESVFSEMVTSILDGKRTPENSLQLA